MIHAKQKNIMDNDDFNSYTDISNSKLFTNLRFLGGFIDKKDQNINLVKI